MKIRDLYEGRDAPLFHFTRHLKATLAVDTLAPGSQAGGGISLTRNLATPFYSYTAKDDSDCLVLDQNALSHRYRMVPMYGDSTERLPGLLTKHKEQGFEVDSAQYVPQNEQEERLFGVVKPLHRYLLAIVVKDGFADDIGESLKWVAKASNDSGLMDVMAIGLYSKTYGIPVVERRSMRPNGTWTADITKVAQAAATKIERRHARDLAKAEKARVKAVY